MRGKNQEQYYKVKEIKSGNQRNYNTISRQSNTYQSNPSQKGNQKGTYYISGSTIQQREQNNKNIYPSNIQEPQTTNFSMISQQNNQINTGQNVMNQMGHRIEKKIYVNQGRGNTEGYRIKKVEINNQKEKSESIISSGENYSNIANINKKKENNNRNVNHIKPQNISKQIEKKNGKKERGRKIESSNSSHNRAKSYLSERKPLNKLGVLDKSLKGKRLPKSVECKRKTIIRGDKYKNIQITHIISTTKPNLDKYDFHIIETLSRVELDKKPLDLSKIKSQIKKDDKAKSSFKSSCDGRIIAPISRTNIQKTTIYQHAAGIGMTDLAPEKINSSFYKSGLLKLPKRIKPKGTPVIQVIEVFRSQQTSSNDRNRSIDGKFNINNVFNKTYNDSSNQRMNKSITSNNVISRSNKGNEKSNVNQNNNKFNENEIEVKNMHINKNNYLSNYYNNLPSNAKNYSNKMNIRKNNIVAANQKENNKEITTSYNINQTNYNKDISNSQSNVARYNRDNIKPLMGSEKSQENKSELKSIDYRNNNNVNLSDRNEIKPTTVNNLYTKTEPKEDFKNKASTINAHRNNIEPNNIFVKRFEQNVISSSKNSPTRQTINPSLNNQQKKIVERNVQSITSPQNIEISNEGNNETITSVSIINKNGNNIEEKATNKVSPSPFNINNINNRQSYNRGKNEAIHNKKSSSETTINNNQISPNNKKTSPKIRINLNEEDKNQSSNKNNRNIKLPSKTDINSNYRTIPIVNRDNIIIQKSPSRSNVNSRYATNQYSINNNRKSPPKTNIHSNMNIKKSPQRININSNQNVNQTSNNKNNRSSPQKQNINSTNNIIRTDYDRDNKK